MFSLQNRLIPVAVRLNFKRVLKCLIPFMSKLPMQNNI